MKKLLIGLAIGATVAGIGLVIKHYRDNEEVEVEEMENEELEEIAIDVEVMDIEDIEIVDEEEIKLLDKIKRFIKMPIKLVVKMAGLLCGILLKINKKLENVETKSCEELAGMTDFEFYFREFNLILGGIVVFINRQILVLIAKICIMLNKLI